VDPAPNRDRGDLATAVGLAVLVAITLHAGLAATALALHPQRSWVVHRGHLPGPELLAPAALTLLCPWAARWRPLRQRWPWLAALLLFGLYLSQAARPLGDHHQRVEQMGTRQLAGSEILSQLAYSLWYRAGLDASLLPPVAGLLTAGLFFSLVRRLTGDGEWPPPWWPPALYAASAVHLVFFRGFIENTSMSIPFVLAFAGALLSYLRAPELALRRVALASLWLTLGCAVHGQVAFLLPALPAVVLMKEHGASGSRIRRLSVLTGTAAAVAGGVVLGVWCLVSVLGYRLVPGNMQGGGDHEMFVPFEAPRGFATFTFLSVNHMVRIGNILAAASPSLLLLGVWRCAREATLLRRLGPSWDLVLPAILTLAYLAFITLWNFDLGFPGDYDLMMTMAVVAQLLVVVLVARWRSAPRWALAAAAGVGILSSWSLVSPFLRR